MSPLTDMISVPVMNLRSNIAVYPLLLLSQYDGGGDKKTGKHFIEENKMFTQTGE
ncbi:hypothetical protein DZS_01210 [Dickeya ananatis]